MSVAQARSEEGDAARRTGLDMARVVHYRAHVAGVPRDFVRTTVSDLGFPHEGAASHLDDLWDHVTNAGELCPAEAMEELAKQLPESVIVILAARAPCRKVFLAVEGKADAWQLSDQDHDLVPSASILYMLPS